MKNILKKILAFVVLFATIFTAPSTVHALESLSDTSAKSTIVAELNELRPIWGQADKYEVDYEILSTWKVYNTYGLISVKKNGMLSLNTEKAYHITSSVAAEKMSDTIAIWNKAILLGFLAFDQKTMQFYTPEITDATIEKATKLLDEIDGSDLTNLTTKSHDNGEVAIVKAASSHGCSYTYKNVGSLCSNNYNDIKNFYKSMQQAAVLSPDARIDPWLSTASYWVGKVREGGSWDYKKIPAYKSTFCCTYKSSAGYKHKNGEWLGNYNYGYTGKQLFSLNALHTGSFVVSKFDPKDKTTDWPAIDQGYKDAP